MISDDKEPPDKDLSHWGDHDEAAWEALELYGYKSPEASGNWIYNRCIESLACMNHPYPATRVGPYAIALKIMFTRCAAFGELDFEP